MSAAERAVAQERATAHGNVELVGDAAAHWQPAAAVDRVFPSCALTMIPGWRRVIVNAVGMQKPRGGSGAVDFHLRASTGPPGKGFRRRWFAHDGEHLSAKHLPALRSRLADTRADERRASVLCLPALQAPCSPFVGHCCQVAHVV